MPLFREWESDPHSLAAIWKIEEPEDFFVAATGIRPDIKSEKRRLEHLAGRYLLQHVQKDFPLHHINKDEHDKPRLPLNQYYFSISHSYPYVAVVVSDTKECGIDIQTWHRRMQQLQHKFLSGREQAYFENDPQLITLAWSAKEAAYKWQGRRGIDFIEHLLIQKFSTKKEQFHFEIEFISAGKNLIESIEGSINEDFALAYVVKKQKSL